MKKTTSWGNVATWYDSLLESRTDTYQHAVILPNLARNLEIQKGEKILDLACGQGFFARALEKRGARVSGVDISLDLITLAKKHSSRNIDFFKSKAESMPMFEDGRFQKVVCILALQNIEDIDKTFREVSRVLKPKGSLYIVLNHPAFRIWKASSWERDKENNYYRRIDKYLSGSKEVITMHPGKDPRIKTISFNRPLQAYIKALRKNGFLIRSLEEWISHKKSEGKHAREENRIRKEIPLFLFLEAIKH